MFVLTRFTFKSSRVQVVGESQRQLPSTNACQGEVAAGRGTWQSFMEKGWGPRSRSEIWNFFAVRQIQVELGLASAGTKL